MSRFQIDQILRLTAQSDKQDFLAKEDCEEINDFRSVCRSTTIVGFVFLRKISVISHLIESYL